VRASAMPVPNRRNDIRAPRAGLVAVMAVVAATLTLVPAATAARTAVKVPQLVWTACGGGFECATAQVPLDYRQPTGATISLALIRLPASD
jgi:hypothetical protein